MGNKQGTTRKGKYARHTNSRFSELPETEHEILEHSILDALPPISDLGEYFEMLPPEILWHIWHFILSSPFSEVIRTVSQVSLINKKFYTLARGPLGEQCYKISCPWFDRAFYERLLNISQDDNKEIDWIRLQRLEGTSRNMVWSRAMTSPAISISKNGRSASINTSYQGDHLTHCAMTRYKFSRGVHVIHFEILDTSWGLSLGVGVPSVGIHPDTHFLQLFADCTYGLFGDDIALTEEMQRILQVPPLQQNDVMNQYGRNLKSEVKKRIPWRIGDIVSIRVDLDVGEVEFFVNSSLVLLIQGLELHPDEQYQEPFRFLVQMKISEVLLRGRQSLFNSAVKILDEDIPLENY